MTGEDLAAVVMPTSAALADALMVERAVLGTVVELVLMLACLAQELEMSLPAMVVWEALVTAQVVVANSVASAFVAPLLRLLAVLQVLVVPR